MTKNPILDAPAVLEKVQEVRWAVCQNCEDGAEWGRIREALDAYALTVEGVVLDEVRRRVEALDRFNADEGFDGRPTMGEFGFGNYLDRAAVLALLDGRDA